MMKISSQILKRNSLALNNYSRRFFSSSNLDSLKTRDQEILNKVMNSDNYSVSEFSNFLRLVNNNKDKNTHQQLLDRFSNELPKHINFLDDLDTRKVISILLVNPSVQNHLPLVKERFSEIKKVKGIKHEDGTVKIGSNMKRQPMSVRFWVGFAKLREKFYMKIRNSTKIELH
jgi:hypothetical protein